MDDVVFGVVEQTDFFLACVSALRAEELIRSSPRGLEVGLLLEAINSKRAEVSEIALILISKTYYCLTAGCRHKLPSASQAAVWSTFHELRRNREVKDVWGKFVSAHIPESCRQESELAFQLIIDRLLKRLLHKKADSKKQSSASAQATTSRSLTALECNAVQYMSGYVAVTLLKKYRKQTKQPLLKVKRELFVHVLTTMKAVDQPGKPESVLDYTKLWSELIDRGGLYHINDEVRCVWQLVSLSVCVFLYNYVWSVMYVVWCSWLVCCCRCIT